MAAPSDMSEDSVFVVIGTGGGVLSNEVAQRGVSVLELESGGRCLPEDHGDDAWDSFGQLARLDPRTTSGDWRMAFPKTGSCFQGCKRRAIRQARHIAGDLSRGNL